VLQGNLIHEVEPRCPAEARGADVSGNAAAFGNRNPVAISHKEAGKPGKRKRKGSCIEDFERNRAIETHVARDTHQPCRLSQAAP